MEFLNDFFTNLKVKDRRILTELEGVEIKKKIFNRKKKILKLYLESPNILRNSTLDIAKNKIKSNMNKYIDDVVIVVEYIGMEKKSSKAIFSRYWDNILYFIEKKIPSVRAYIDNVEYMTIDNILKIKLPNTFIYNRFKSSGLDIAIKSMILDELGIDFDIVVEKAVEAGEDHTVEKYLEDRDKDMMELLRNISKITESEEELQKDEKKYMESREKPDRSNMVFGDNVNAIFKHMDEISPEDKSAICVEGEVFKVDKRDIKNGKVLYTIYVTDNRYSIACRLHLNDTNLDKVEKNTKPGTYLRLKGDISINSYTDEIEMNTTGISKAERKIRVDDSKEKRVELHAHTQMSQMDSVAGVGDLIKRAIEWGHKAIAITDHGVVQAFPDAMNAAKGKIKILYGVEAYLVDDAKDVIQNANDKDLNQTFVVFDIETTGLSVVGDRLTEIGAVKIQNKKIVGSFSTFVNPKMDISYKIQELTRITNDMVKDAPSEKEALEDFFKFCGDCVMVAHNADFDTGFVMQKCKELGIDYNYEKIDTMLLSMILLPELKKFNLKAVTKASGVMLSGHHRAVNDAQATAEVFIKFLEKLNEKGVEVLSDVNKIYGKIDYKKVRPTHATIFAKNYEGLKNLYRLISDSHINHFYRYPLILKSMLSENREGLIVGSACSSGEVFNSVLRNLDDKRIEKIVDFYDFIEVMPIDNNRYLLEEGEIKSIDELKNINKRIVDIGIKKDKIVVATGDVHMLDEHEDIYRKILKHSQKFRYGKSPEKLHFRTTDEMLGEFRYLGEELAYEIVVKNTNKIADMVEEILPIPSDTYPPVIEGSEDTLRNMCFEKAVSIYGDPLPKIVEDRLNKELNSIIGNGYAVMYIIANKLVAKSLSDGYLVGSRGSVGSSFAATMADITEVNPLPAHYVCPNCRYSYFYKVGEWGSGIDLPDKDCPNCGHKLKKDGHDIPFEVFLGFEGDKEPDIDLNFSGVYQPTIHKYTEEFFGDGHVYRAGTIGTVKDKTAFGYSQKFSDENNLYLSSAEINRLTKGCTGVKRTTGQHPGGVMVIPDYKDVHDFTPIQYPANDKSSGVITTHFDYHSISGRILKLDILGHDGPTMIRMLEDIIGIKITDIPLDDPETMSIFLNTDALGVKPEDIDSEVGSIAVPEFGTKFTRQMLIDTKPTTFAELVRIAGLSHGTDVWLNNAQDLVRSNVVGLKDVISTRDDIMNYLIFKGLKPKLAFTIMESVRKGKGLKPEFEEEMRDKNVPEWYISSCKKIKYMFPKAHAVAYVMTSFRLAYCKVHYPEAFYATYFTTKVEDFDIELASKGIDSVRKKMAEIKSQGSKATTKEQSQMSVLEVVVEMYSRGISLSGVDIYKSDLSEFKVGKNGEIIPPLTSFSGLGESAAQSVVEEREKGKFLSQEDLISRTKLTQSIVKRLREHGALGNMGLENQVTFFG